MMLPYNVGMLSLPDNVGYQIKWGFLVLLRNLPKEFSNSSTIN